MRTAILVVSVALIASACATGGAAPAPSAAPPERSSVGAVAEGELTLEIAELI